MPYVSVVPGTSVGVHFQTFPNQYPPLYEAANQGSLNLASVNAGNADTLCVGLGGVNLQFLSDLSPTQKNANLNQCNKAGSRDDYQDRHVKLLEAAAAGGPAWERYANTDPCAFSYVEPTGLGPNSATYEGVCFVDVFDPKLCPGGDPKNFAMVYVAPPDGQYFQTHASFLAAIQTTAENMIRAVAGYNAIAAANGLPLVEALRNTLFSSSIYNRVPHLPQVPLAVIARAIFAGIASELAKHPDCGLVELQFPVGDGSKLQGDVFAALKSDLGSGGQQAAATVPDVAHSLGGAPKSAPRMAMPLAQASIFGGGKPVVIDEPVAEPEGFDPEEEAAEEEAAARDANEPATTEMKGVGENAVQVKQGPIGTANAAVRQATRALSDLLTGTVTPDSAHVSSTPARAPQRQYGEVPRSKRRVDSDADVDDRLSDESDFHESSVSQEVEDKSKVLRSDDVVVQKAREAIKCAREVHNAAVDVLRATTTKRAMKIRDHAKTVASEAETAAQLADGAAVAETDGNKQPASDALARASREVAGKAKTLAEKIDAGVKRAQAVRRAMRIKKAWAAAGVSGTVLGGIATWVFVFGGGRKVLGDGPLRFRTRPLRLDVLEGAVQPATMDVIKELDIPFVAANAVHLVDDNGARLKDAAGAETDTLTRMDGKGTWKATGHTISFQPSNAAAAKGEVNIKYVVEGSSAQAGTPTTDPAEFTVGFWPKAPDRQVKAADRGTPVTFTGVVDGSTLPEGWTWDASAKTASYTIPDDASTALVKASYSIGFQENSADLVILLPALDRVPDPADANKVYPRMGSTEFKLPDPSPAQWKLTSADSAWKLAGNKLTYTPPDGLAGTVTSAAIQYALTLDAVDGKAGTATVKLAATATMTGKLPARIITAIAPNRTSANFEVAIPDDVKGFALKQPAAGWTLDPAGKKAVFTPPTTGLATATASAGYSSTSHEDSTVEIVFPMDIKITDAKRNGANEFDIAKANPSIMRMFTVTVEDIPNEPLIGVWAVQGGKVVFAAKKGEGALQERMRSVNKVYVMTFTDGSKARAKLTAELTEKFTAYDIVVRPADPMNPAISTTIDPAKYCYVPAGWSINRFRLEGNLLVDKPDATWNLKNTVVGTTTVTTVEFVAKDTGKTSYTLNYTVVARRNGSNPPEDVESNPPAKITVSRDPLVQTTIMPKAATCFNSTAINGGQTVVLPVLRESSAFHAKNPKSVVLTGLQDAGQAMGARQALLAKDGKSMVVPNEGVWLVCDDGEIAFTADPSFAVPPTPVGFRFADVMGNMSDTGVVVIDPDVTHTLALPETLKAMDEKTFWQRFHANVSGRQSTLGSDGFISYAAIFSGALREGLSREKIEVGPELYDLDGYAKAVEEYKHGGSGWEDLPAKKLRGVVSICKDIVTAAAPAGTDERVVRYWRLELMSRVVAQSLKDDPTAV